MGGAGSNYPRTVQGLDRDQHSALAQWQLGPLWGSWLSLRNTLGGVPGVRRGEPRHRIFGPGLCRLALYVNLGGTPLVARRFRALIDFEVGQGSASFGAARVVCSESSSLQAGEWDHGVLTPRRGPVTMRGMGYLAECLSLLLRTVAEVPDFFEIWDRQGKPFRWVGTPWSLGHDVCMLGEINNLALPMGAPGATP